MDVTYSISTYFCVRSLWVRPCPGCSPGCCCCCCCCCGQCRPSWPAQRGGGAERRRGRGTAGSTPAGGACAVAAARLHHDHTGPARTGTTAVWNTAADQVQQLPETQQLIRYNSYLKHSSWSGTTVAWNTAADQVQQLPETQQLIRYNRCLKHSSWSGNTKVWNSSGSGTTAAWNSSWSGTTAVWKSSWSVTTAVWSNSWSGTAAVWNSTWSGATSVWNSSWSGTTAKMIQMPPQCCHCQRGRLTPKYQVIKLSINRTADLLTWLYEKEQLTNWPAQHSWSDKATVSNRQLIILHWAL